MPTKTIQTNIHIQAALDGLIHLYTRPSFHLSYLVLYQSVNQRWSPFALGCNSVRCLSGSVHADHLLSRPDGLERKKATFYCVLMLAQQFLSE